MYDSNEGFSNFQANDIVRALKDLANSQRQIVEELKTANNELKEMNKILPYLENKKSGN